MVFEYGISRENDFKTHKRCVRCQAVFYTEKNYCPDLSCMQILRRVGK